jgi:hypothetical protein
MDPVVLLDRCWTVNVNILGGAAVTTGYARDLVRMDGSWATVDAGGPSVTLMGLEGQNWFNTAYTNILSDTKSGEVVPASAYGEQSPYPMVLWNKKLRLAGGSEVPELAPWNLFMDTGWPNAPLKYNSATAGFTAGLAGAHRPGDVLRDGLAERRVRLVRAAGEGDVEPRGESVGRTRRRGSSPWTSATTAGRRSRRSGRWICTSLPPGRDSQRSRASSCRRRAGRSSAAGC